MIDGAFGVRPETRIYWIAFGITLSLVLPMVGTTVAVLLIPRVAYEHIQLHCLLEISGALMSLAIAGILAVQRSSKADSQHYAVMACGFAAMGTLDLFHASIDFGNAFVWLHNVSTLLGGALFAAVWMAGRKLPQRLSRAAPAITIAAVATLGIAAPVDADAFAPDGRRRQLYAFHTAGERIRRQLIYRCRSILYSSLLSFVQNGRLAVCGANNAAGNRGTDVSSGDSLGCDLVVGTYFAVDRLRSRVCLRSSSLPGCRHRTVDCQSRVAGVEPEP